MTEILHSPITEVSKILRKLLISFDNISGSELAKRCGIPVSTINRILAGTVIDPKISTLKPLANYFGISVDQLMGYSSLPERFNCHTQSLRPTMALPVFQLKNFNLKAKLPQKWFTWVSERQSNDNIFAVSIETNEFEPIFSKDSILVIEPSMLPPVDEDYVAVLFKDSNVISLKKYKIDDQDHYLVPLNPQLKATLCSEKQFNLLGVISEAHVILREY